MSTYRKISDLPLRIEGCELTALRHSVSDGFTRVTTLVKLLGMGGVGIGEDLIYELPDQERFQREGARLPIAGSYTLDSFCRHLESLELFSAAPEDRTAPAYRRWAIESAALDLALVQAGLPLWRVLDREPQPVHFVVSLGLGNPPSLQRVDALVARCSSIKLKLDARSSWDEALFRALQQRGVVSCIDLKGHYLGSSIYQPPERLLYERVFAYFPDAWIEDAAASPATRPLLEEHWHRLSWDAPIRCVADIDALPRQPAAINVKPSRFGSLQNLFDAYDYCLQRGIKLYGGGDFELGPGRMQIQYLASLFHPSASNDVAPSLYNQLVLPDSPLPGSPLPIAAAARGFSLA